MSLIALFVGEHGLLASRRAVFAADDVVALDGARESAEHLDALLGGERERVARAEADGARRGHAEGLAAGRREAADDAAREQLARQTRFADELRRIEDASVATALEIVRRVAGDVAPGTWLAAQASRAAAELAEQAPLVLRVHPERVRAVRDALPADGSPFDDVVGDETLVVGGCSIETRFGRVDTALDTQLERIRELGESDGESDGEGGGRG